MKYCVMLCMSTSNYTEACCSLQRHLRLAIPVSLGLRGEGFRSGFRFREHRVWGVGVSGSPEAQASTHFLL